MFRRRERIAPGPGQESVWDYPRPPHVEPVAQRLVARFGGETIAETTRGWRVLETSHPPVHYFPPEDVRKEFVQPAPGRSFCEFKGEASYVTIVAGGRRAERAGWLYARPAPGFEAIAGAIAFYASRLDEAFVGAEKVEPQAGDFYGGWVTRNIVGPFKGGPGTAGW